MPRMFNNNVVLHGDIIKSDSDISFTRVQQVTALATSTRILHALEEGNHQKTSSVLEDIGLIDGPRSSIHR